MNAAPPSNPAVLHQAGRVVAGAGCLARLADLVAERAARHVLVVCGRHVVQGGLLAPAREALEARGITVTVWDGTPPEPELKDVDAVLDAALAAGRAGVPVDLVVGLGGGSAIDVAKIVANLLAHAAEPHAHLRAMLKGQPVPGRGLPNVMVPTTAGTGAEATPNSIILVPDEAPQGKAGTARKIGIVSPWLLPDVVLLDPLLTTSLPPAVTASTGMDALTHAIECYCSKKGNAFSDLFALEAIRLIAGSIRRAYRDGQDVQARQDMLMGAYWGGVCIATSSTTAVHALAYPLGGTYRVPHGLSNAMLLPTIMAFNLEGNEARFAAMARAMGLPVQGQPDRTAGEAFVQALVALNADLDITTRLGDLGVTEAELGALVEGAAQVTRLLDNNPRPISREQMRALYQRML